MTTSNKSPLFFILYNKLNHTLLFNIHIEFLLFIPKFTEEDLPSYLEKEHYPLYLKFSKKNILGLGGIYEEQGVYDDYATLAINIDNTHSNEDLQAKLYLMTRALDIGMSSYRQEINDDSPIFQHLVPCLDTYNTSKTTGGAGIAGSLSLYFQEQCIKLFQKHGNPDTGRVTLPTVIDAMVDIWAHRTNVSPKQVPQDEFKARIDNNGKFFIACPGTNTSSVFTADNNLGSTLDGLAFINHNVDSRGQQITLFVALIMLYECVMESRL